MRLASRIPPSPKAVSPFVYDKAVFTTLLFFPSVADGIASGKG